MVVLRDHRGGRLAGDRVEVVAGRLALRLPVAAAPAVAAQPAVAGGARRRPDPLERLGERGAAVELDLVLRERPRREMDVRVVEAGQDDAAAEVDRPRARRAPSRARRRRPRSCSPAIASARCVGTCGSSVRISPFARIMRCRIYVVSSMTTAVRPVDRVVRRAVGLGGSREAVRSRRSATATIRARCSTSGGRRAQARTRWWSCCTAGSGARSTAAARPRRSSVALTSAGLATANVEYRRLGPGTYRPMLDDVVAARKRLDASRASAHRRARPLRRRPPRAVARGRRAASRERSRWAESRDLEAAARERLGRDAVRELLGGAPTDVASAYEEADPARRLPLGVPHVLVHGAATRTCRSTMPAGTPSAPAWSAGSSSSTASAIST